MPFHADERGRIGRWFETDGHDLVGRHVMSDHCADGAIADGPCRLLRRDRSSRGLAERSHEADRGCGEGDSSLSTRRIGVLIPPTCGFEERYDGDWIVSDRPDGKRRIVECPECRGVVVSQPVFGSEDST